MSKVESLEDFYRNKYNWLPESMRNQTGHFNVFKLDPYVGEGAKPAPYKRRDYFKIMLVKGNGKFHYADKVIEVKKYALVFSNPQIPYSWEQRDSIAGGDFCIFDQAFFYHYGNLNQYTLFQPDGNHVFELNEEQMMHCESTFKRMFEEINSDYIHKYELLRSIVYELVHFAMKMQPSTLFDKQPINASQRISTLFLDLLERQFPIDDLRQVLVLRAASDYAEKLNIHVNYLNRAIKEATDKTTTHIISERIMQEAKTLLKQTPWPVPEIAYVLGFSAVTHFNNFFKKHTNTSPSKFRKV
jgi:AraC-like DNA-binding protein